MAEELKPKTGKQKALKVLSIIQIILSIIVLVIGVLALVGGGTMAAAGADMAVSGGTVIVAGVVVVVSGIINLIVGILGLRGANNPSKITPFLVFVIIGLILAVISLILAIVGGTFTASNIVSVVFDLILLWLALGVKKLA